MIRPPIALPAPDASTVPPAAPPVFRWSLRIAVAMFALVGGRMVYAQPDADSPVRAAPAAAAAYGSAAALQDQGLFDLAVDEWQVLLKAYPNDAVAPRAHYNLGVCLFQAGEFAAAADRFAVVSEPTEHPQLAEQALANRGLALFNAAQGEQRATAEATLRQALAAFDTQLSAYGQGSQATAALEYSGAIHAELGDDRAAAAVYRRILSEHPESTSVAAARLGLGQALIELSQLDEAEAALNPLVDTAPDLVTRTEALHLRGEARLAGGRFAAAAEDFAAIVATPGAADADHAQLRRAFCLFKVGAQAEAVAAYDQLVQSWPASPLVGEARVAAAKCLVTRGDYAAAKPRLIQIWNTQPAAENAPVAHWLARCLLETNADPGETLALVDAALAASPDKAWVAELSMDRADALRLAPSRSAEAVDAYVALADKELSNPLGQQAAVLATRTALGSGNAQQAADLAAKYLAAGVGDESTADLLQISGEAYSRLGVHDEAAKSYRRLLTEFTDDDRRPLWALRLAKSLAETTEWATVQDVLPPVLDQLDGESFDAAALLLADTQTQLGAIEPAIATLTRLVDRDPPTGAFARALYERGRHYSEIERRELGSADFRRLLAERPEHMLAPYARFALASNAYAVGELAECVTQLDPFARDGAIGPVGAAMLLRATAQHEVGDHAAALESLAKAAGPAAELLYLRGVCESRLGRIRPAQATLAACLEAEGAEAVADRALYELAWVQDGAQLRDKADQLFTRLADEYPDSPLAAEANLRVGQSHYAAKRYADAVPRFERASTSAEPALREQALHLLGWSGFEAGDFDQAISAFERQIAAAPAGDLASDGQLMIAESHFAAGRFEESLSSFDAALESAAVRQDLRLLGLLHAGQAAGKELNEWERAVGLLDRARAASEGSPRADEIAFEHAWALHKLGDDDRALPEFNRLANSANTPLAAQARFVAGELQFAAGQHEQAVRTFFRVAYGYGGLQAPAEFHPWQSEALFEAARCLEQLDRDDPARKLYAELVERFPESAKAEHARRRLQRTAAR